ncbi:hypothetical protein [Yersinia rohdei]|nr:hypothetical protein [Yersinia rohdei]
MINRDLLIYFDFSDVQLVPWGRSQQPQRPLGAITPSDSVS